MFGHLPEIIALLVVGLLVFGPKRMIDMGSQFGKAFREFREATRELSLSNLMSSDEPTPRQSTLSKLSQMSQSFGASSVDTSVEPESVSPQIVVDSSIGQTTAE